MRSSLEAFLLLAPPDSSPGAADVPPGPGDAPPGWLLDQYELVDVLGRGSAGVVYRMRERAGGRLAAVKVAGTAAARAELVWEAELAGRLRHPNVLAVRALHGPAGAVALASPCATGGTLRTALAAARAERGPDARAPLGYARTAAVLRDVAAALAHVHAAGLVHADVKPENVFLDDATGRALLGDFGIARPADAGAGAPQPAAAGTPAYMAPEQAAGAPLDPRTDVYALGLLGWELLAGRRPWEGLAVEAVLHAQRHEALPPLGELCPDVPAFLLAAVEGALAKDPDARWADGGAMLRRLTPTPASLPAVSRPDPALAGAPTLHFAPRGRAERGAGRGWARRAGAVAGILAAAAVGAVAFEWSHERAPVRAATTPPRIRPVMGGGPAASRPASDVASPAPRVAGLAPGTPATPSTPIPPGSPTANAPPPCGTPTAAAQRTCARRLAGAADGRVAAAVRELEAAMRAAAPSGWEPAAVRQLRAEQARWTAEAARECRVPAATEGAADWGQARGACLAERADRRAAALQLRRARFSPTSAPSPEPPR